MVSKLIIIFVFRPVEYLSAKSSVVTGTSPSMSEDEDEEAAQRRMTLERWSTMSFEFLSLLDKGQLILIANFEVFI